MAKAPDPLPSVYSNPYFKLLLIINCVVFVGCMVIMVWAASFTDDKTGDMPKGKERLFGICSYLVVSTAGAFVGLLCGRAAVPDPPR